MKRIILLALALCFMTVSSLTVIASAAKSPGAGTASPMLGIDISYPQCKKTVPTNQVFAIVGVNGGTANTTNECLAKQIAWGAKSPGGQGQDPLQLYVNTGNPAGLNTASWEMGNLYAYVSDPVSIGAPGECRVSSDGIHGEDSVACAWLYGWNRAHEDITQRFPLAAEAAGVSTDPQSYRWWLDVETVNTWKTGKTDADFVSNVAILEGMATYFKTYINSDTGTIGLRYGVYSTNYQWGVITGNKISEQSGLRGLPVWYPVGRAPQSTAQKACTQKPLVNGNTLEMTQFINGGLDYNYSCKKN